MQAHISAFWLAKHGCRPEEYEDAYRLPIQGSEGEFRGSRLRITIADGATESLLAKQWAQLLVERCMVHELSVADAIQLAMNEWPATVDEYVRRRIDSGRPIAWYEEPGLSRSACATLLVLNVNGKNEDADCRSGKYSAKAVGDSCLFHVSPLDRPLQGSGHGQPQWRLLKAHPVKTSTDFGVTPDLVQSQSPESDGDRSIASCRGRWAAGDTLYLATDALSQWILAEHEKQDNPWAALNALGTEDLSSFPEWIDGLRSSGLMRNDDVTLVRIDFL